jgi:PAS domain S-box-containing protein
MIVLITLLLTAGIFVFDVLPPLGIGEWGLYLIPMLISFHAQPRRYPLMLAALCTGLLVIGYWCSAAGIDPQSALLSRGIGVCVLWMTAVLLVKRKCAEAALNEKEQRLRAILHYSPAAIFVKDLSGRYLEYSRQCEINTGKTRDEVLGRTDHELFGRERHAEFVMTDKMVLETGKEISHQIKFSGRKGIEAHLVIKFPLLDNEGKFNAIGGVAANITDLKNTERALRENQERLDLAQAEARIGTFDWVIATNKVVWSAETERMYGLPPGGFGNSYESWAELIHPADRSRVEAETYRAIQERREFNAEFRIVRPDKSVRWIKSVSKPFNDDSGRVERVVGINVDVTEQKRAQEAILFSNQRLGMIAQVTATVVGATPLKEEGRKLAEQVMTAFGMDACVIRTLERDGLVMLASAGMLDEKLQSIISSDGEVFQRVLACRRPIFVPDALENPSTRPFVERLHRDDQFISYAGAPLLVQDQVVGILGIYSKKQIPAFTEADLGHLQIVANHIAVAIANDRLFKEVQRQTDRLGEQITERERAEDALKQTTEQLQTLSRRLLELQEAERRHIARELHDEIGQALTALKINLQAVQRTFDADHALPRLLDSINIVDRTLRQVRNLSLDLRPSMLDDLGLCAALRWYADQQAQRAGLRIHFLANTVDADLGSSLKTTCFRVAQEALTNVIRHARAKTVTIELSQEDGLLHLAVCDDGIGFDVEMVRGQPGVGASLGLLGMEERASLAGGRIELKSTRASGTEVHVWFPVAHGDGDLSPALIRAEE